MTSVWDSSATMWNVVQAVDWPSGSGEEGKKDSEDLAGASGTMVWVLDGASAVGNGRITPATSDARWMVEHLSGHLEDLADDDLPLATIVSRAIEATEVDSRTDWNPQHKAEFPPSAALGLVRRRGSATEYLVLADVSVVLLTADGAVEVVDRRVDRYNQAAHDAMREVLCDEDATLADALAVARPLLADVRRTAMNREPGYWVASIDSTAAEHALTGSVEGATEVVLASDGFMRAVEFGLVTLEELFECDFEILAKQIRTVEKADPNTRAHARWSVSDDICARRLRWSELTPSH